MGHSHVQVPCSTHALRPDGEIVKHIMHVVRHSTECGGIYDE